MKKGFDNEHYVEKQSENILKRIKESGNKLYLEFGGKLFDDFHAARVLPGFDPNVKIKLIEKLKDKVEMIFCISAADIERNKIRADFDITYGTEVIRLIDIMKERKIKVNSVVITQYSDQPAVKMFKQKLIQRGEKVYIHTLTKGYPTDVDTIVSDEGYGKNPYIKTTRPLIIVTAPGPSSGKLATCLCQLYHEYKLGNKCGYAKFETFPVWNLPLKHPVNMAYEAATADLKDVNMIDYFHLEEYGVQTVNYNRDIEIFPVLKAIVSKISEDKLKYKSPTDMGVNMVGYCITDDDYVKDAAKQEIIRRYFTTKCAIKNGSMEIDALQRIEFLMGDLKIKPEDRKVVLHARKKAEDTNISECMAMELQDGSIITSKKSELMSASSALVINAIKHLANIDDSIKLLSIDILAPILKVKKEVLRENKSLSLEEVLVALSVCTATNKLVEKAVEQLQNLKCAEVHSTKLLSAADKTALRKLGLNVTMDTDSIIIQER